MKSGEIQSGWYDPPIVADPAHRTKSRVIRVAAYVALAAITIWLAVLPRSTFLVRASYDLLHWFGAGPVSSNFPVVIVYLDLPSHVRLNIDPAHSWPRSLHADLVTRLKQAGSRAIVFDILFAEPGENSEADRQFADAIRADGKVILGAEWNRGGRNSIAGASFEERTTVLPLPILRQAAAGYGFVFSKVESDFEVREMFPGFIDRGLPSLSWAAAQLLGQDSPSPGRRWIRYYGPPLAIPHVSIADVLSPGAIPDEFLRDKVVFVGARPEAGRFDERRDELKNPFSVIASGVRFMPGVEVHATQLANILRRDALRRFPPFVEAVLLGASALFLGVVFLKFRPIPGAAFGLGAELAVLAVATALFTRLGTWFPWLLVSAIQIPGAWLISVASHSAEWILERRRYLARIREQATLIDKAQDAIQVHDLQGRVIFQNPKAVELFGRGIPSLASEPLAEARTLTLETGEWTGEFVHHHRVLHSHWTLLRDDKGAALQLLQVSTDITEKKRLEEQFARAQRLEGVWAMAGGMAHDLNSALAPVVMGLQRLRKRTTDQDSNELIAVMQDAAKRSAEMVGQVLSSARQRSLARESVNPNELLRDVEKHLAFTLPASIILSVLCPPDVWRIFGNKTQLQQVLLNLCHNARDAMPQGGEITLAADNVSLTQEQADSLAGARPGEYVLLVVSDTGPGIPDDLQPRLFEAFATSKADGQGTGLGLFTSSHIVRAHGGFLDLKSEPGKGSTFDIYLPRPAT